MSRSSAGWNALAVASGPSTAGVAGMVHLLSPAQTVICALVAAVSSVVVRVAVAGKPSAMIAAAISVRTLFGKAPGPAGDLLVRVLDPTPGPTPPPPPGTGEPARRPGTRRWTHRFRRNQS